MQTDVCKKYSRPPPYPAFQQSPLRERIRPVWFWPFWSTTVGNDQTHDPTPEARSPFRRVLPGIDRAARAQREAVRVFLDGSVGALTEAFIEVESDRNDASQAPRSPRPWKPAASSGPCWLSEVPDDLRSSTHLVVRSVDGRRQIRRARLTCRQ
jgi:hypothetical protein